MPSVGGQETAAVPREAPINPEYINWLFEHKEAAQPQVVGPDGTIYYLGHIPSPLDRSHLKDALDSGKPREGLPASYDLRDYGQVTSVKNQDSCSSCWAFASYGSLESCLLKNVNETWDLSENHLKNYHGFDWGPCDGGNTTISTAYLNRWSGPVSEADDPYHDYDDRPSPGGSCQKYVTDVYWFHTDYDIKNAIMNYGAQYVSMYFDSAYYNSATNTYWYSITVDPHTSNHGVTLIGWDDNKEVPYPPSGQSSFGAWLVKNSWGTGWGDNGYFWISYNDTVAVSSGTAFCGAVPTTMYSTNYDYDPYGCISSFGFSTNTAWGANIFTAEADEDLAAVGFYARTDNTSYEIYIYDDFNGSSFSNLLGSTTGTVRWYGYHTIALPARIPLTMGDDFGIVIKFTTPYYNYPVPYEYAWPGYCSAASANPGESYYSNNGITFTDLTTWEPTANCCIRGLTSHPPVYVDDTATGANNGTSWEDAFTDLQTALAMVNSDEIRVAQGTYKATAGLDRTASFQLKNGVNLRGGYAGFGAPNPDARDVELYETILSGDIGTPSNSSDNSYHVVTGDGTNATALLDGFRITLGNGNSTSPYNCGGGMVTSNGSPTVTNCTFSNNSAIYGGGMFNVNNSRPKVTNCNFSDNSADEGGGIYNYESSPTVTDCTLSNNSATYGYGGGMLNVNGSPTVLNCVISGNEANEYGGGMSNDYQSSPTVTNCTFSGNGALNWAGGGMSNQNNSSPTVTQCTFSENSAYASGGGMENHESSPTVTQCTFSENTSGVWGGGMWTYQSRPVLTDCIFNGNTVSLYGGGIATRESSSTVTNCTFKGNSALSGHGGGMCNYAHDSIHVTNCSFEGNTASGGGGGILSWEHCDIKVTNCIFWNNSATDGPQIAVVSETILAISYSDLAGGVEGIYCDSFYFVDDNGGNIQQDPLFVDAAGGDLRLQKGSPCIDAADTTAIPAGVLVDLDGNPRAVNNPATADTGIGIGNVTVDMGAYEFQPCIPILEGDVNCDGRVDLLDLALMAWHWLEEETE